MRDPLKRGAIVKQNGWQENGCRYKSAIKTQISPGVKSSGVVTEKSSSTLPRWIPLSGAEKERLGKFTNPSLSDLFRFSISHRVGITIKSRDANAIYRSINIFLLLKILLTPDVEVERLKVVMSDGIVKGLSSALKAGRGRGAGWSAGAANFITQFSNFLQSGSQIEITYLHRHNWRQGNDVRKGFYEDDMINDLYLKIWYFFPI